MNIVLTIDSNFAPQASALIASICENNRNVDKISFYILTTGMKNNDGINITNLVSSYKRNIDLIEIGDIFQLLDHDFDTSAWNEIVMARLFIARFLPKEIHRVLYLDADTIVRDDLLDLWNTDLKGCILGAVREPTAPAYRRNELHLKKMKYYNAGVLLIDLDKWRSCNTEKKLLDYCKAHCNLMANDQDAINAALESSIFELAPAYNFYNSFYHYPYRALNKMCAPVKYINEPEFNRSVSNPIIIHFAGEERPWRVGNTHHFRFDYEHYLALTPYANVPFEKGWELYFKAYGLFTKMMVPFPMLRWKIITLLIPSFLRYRARKRKKLN